jgi:eukaryotic-like serine/threonine-protein kinase
MAPELLQGRRFGTPADVWALGCFLVEVLGGGGVPWAGLAVPEIIDHVVSKKHAPALPATLPREIADLTRRCFAFEPADRPAAADLLRALLDYKPPKSHLASATKSLGGADALDSLLRK